MLLAGFTARQAFAPEDIGFKEKYDIEGESRIDFVWESRGLYSYRESGRTRKPSFDNLFMRGRTFARAAKVRARLHERSDYCIYDPPRYGTRRGRERGRRLAGVHSAGRGKALPVASGRAMGGQQRSADRGRARKKAHRRGRWQ